MKTPLKVRHRAKEKVWASSALEAARALSVSRESLRKWVYLEGSPGKNGAGRYNLREWRKWMAENKSDLTERIRTADDSHAPLSRKKQIEEALAEEALKKAKRENAEADSRTMLTDDVDGLIFEVLANFDFHLQNAERELTLKLATAFKSNAREMRGIVKPCFDSFRLSFQERPLPQEAKMHINEWLALPDAIRTKIIAGKLRKEARK